MVAVLLLTLPLAAALPMRSPWTPGTDLRFQLSAGLSGEGDPREIGRVPLRSARIDVTPVAGVGVFADAGWSTLRLANQSLDQGWIVGGGARARLSLAPPLGLALAARASGGTSWRLMPGNLREDVSRAIVVQALPAAVLKTTEGDAFAWAGPAFTLTGTRLLEPGGGGFDWTNADERVGLEVGGEMRSDDLLGYGRAGELFLTAGLAIHAVDHLGATTWLGFGF
jgi:hypothetical protein